MVSGDFLLPKMKMDYRAMKKVKWYWAGRENTEMGHLGFSYVGLIFLLMLVIPNLLWTKNMPYGYSAEHENKILVLLERTGEALTTCIALLFSDFNWQGVVIVVALACRCVYLNDIV